MLTTIRPHPSREVPDRCHLVAIVSMAFEKEIRLQNLTYNYPNTGVPVIEDIKLAIEYKSTVTFVGPTRDGKTSLVDIIFDLLVPQKGVFWVADVKVDENSLLNWQSNIGYVSKFTYLSDNRVIRNITFRVPYKQNSQQAVKWDVHVNYTGPSLPNINC